jgi:regulator of protease activity HflC (stomatin/prohibitin superfamily)
MNDFLLIAAALPLAIAALGLRRVPAQRVMTIRRFGRYRRTLAPGWHWVAPGIDRAGLEVDLINHHLHVSGADNSRQAEFYYQIVEPEKAGETLDRVDDWVASQAREALAETGQSPDQLKTELNRRVGGMGLRVIRCSLHVG